VSLGAECGRVVFAVHGIRTNGEWLSDLSDILLGAGVRLATFRYGYFGIWRFLSPSARRDVADAFVAWFRDRTREMESNACRPSVVAHSFGTIVVTSALLENSDLKVDRLILSGAIVPRDFDWQLLIGRGQVRHVENDVGTRDVWAGIVGRCIMGMGPSGRVGFHETTCGCRNRCYPRYRHCDFVRRVHIEKEWLPLLAGDAVGCDE